MKLFSFLFLFSACTTFNKPVKYSYKEVTRIGSFSHLPKTQKRKTASSEDSIYSTFEDNFKEILADYEKNKSINKDKKYLPDLEKYSNRDCDPRHKEKPSYAYECLNSSTWVLRHLAETHKDLGFPPELVKEFLKNVMNKEVKELLKKEAKIKALDSMDGYNSAVKDGETQKYFVGTELLLSDAIFQFPDFLFEDFLDAYVDGGELEFDANNYNFGYCGYLQKTSVAQIQGEFETLPEEDKASYKKFFRTFLSNSKLITKRYKHITCPNGESLAELIEKFDDKLSPYLKETKNTKAKIEEQNNKLLKFGDYQTKVYNSNAIINANNCQNVEQLKRELKRLFVNYKTAISKSIQRIQKQNRSNIHTVLEFTGSECRGSVFIDLNAQSDAKLHHFTSITKIKKNKNNKARK